MNEYYLEQFKENFGVVTESDFEKLRNIRVLVVGLGGLGGHFVNGLVRLGVTNLTLCDYDHFDPTNLNRQLFSNHHNLGKFKAKIIREELRKINPKCNIKVHMTKIQNLTKEKVNDCDYIIDAVDNLITKVFIAELGRTLNKPVLHGACAGWYGQVGWITPKSNLIHDLYETKSPGLEKELKNPSFSPAMTASVMVSEFLKMIKGSDTTTIDELLLIDLDNGSITKTNS